MDTINEAELAGYVDRLRAEMRAAYVDQRSACEAAVLVMRRLVLAEALLDTFREPRHDLLEVLQALAGEHRAATHEPERKDPSVEIPSEPIDPGITLDGTKPRTRGQRGPDKQPRKRRGGRPPGEYDQVVLEVADRAGGNQANQIRALTAHYNVSYHTARTRLKRARARALGTSLTEVIAKYADKPAETPAVPRPRAAAIDAAAGGTKRRAKKAAAAKTKPAPRFPANDKPLEWDLPARPPTPQPSIDDIPRRAQPRYLQGATV